MKHLGSNAEATDAGETEHSTFTTDPIVALLQQYPENTTVDASTPLSNEELFSTSA